MQKRRKKKTSPLIPILVILIIIIGAILFINRPKKDEQSNQEVNYSGSSLTGTFVYESNNTKYTFNEDGTGSMNSDSFNFEYKYKVNGNNLSIDFTREDVHDVVYTFEVKDGVLKLISKEGTVSIGEEYILKKENK